MPENEKIQTQIEGLATLLVLAEEIRKLTNIREFGFFSTNETHRLIPYHTAYLWQKKEFIGPQLIAQSGTAEIDIHVPSNQWLINMVNHINQNDMVKDIQQLNAEELKNDSSITSEWPDVMPQYLLWCPLINKHNQVNGGLIFFRETQFSEAEMKMLGWLIASYQYTWTVLVKPQKIPRLEKFKEKPYLFLLSFIILCILFFPIRISVFGDGTVVPRDPAVINAPMQGVIKSFAVSPGDKVRAGQLLLTIDKTDLSAAAEVSRKAYLLTQSKLRTAINEGFENKDRSEVPIIQAQLAIDKSQLDYANELLAKADVTSPIAGIVIFESKEDWVGQPVRTGERILVVANSEKVELKVTIPVANMIKLKIGDKGELFLYGHLSAIPIHIKTLGYNAKLLPNKILAYQLEASFNNSNDIPDIGSQGTVKIYGHHVPFIYYLFRKPLQSFRQMLGI